MNLEEIVGGRKEKCFRHGNKRKKKKKRQTAIILKVCVHRVQYPLIIHELLEAKKLNAKKTSQFII